MFFLRAGDWSQPTGLSNLIFLCILAVAGLIYVTPTIIAFVRHHPQKVSIAALNIFGGWAGVTWIFALVWAVQSYDRG